MMKHGLKGEGGEGKKAQEVLAPSSVIDFLVWACRPGDTDASVCLSPDRGAGG